jgi:predicted acyltransferase
LTTDVLDLGIDTPVASPVERATRPSRIIAVDAYRGAVMMLMLAEVLKSCAVSAAMPTSALWRAICGQQSHAVWVGYSLHDLIAPSFYFLLGIGVHLSQVRRRAAGEPRWKSVAHVAVRSVVLVFLGMALFAAHPRQWVWMFNDAVTQMGLAYPFVYAIALQQRRYRLTALVAILSAYWLWFALSPLPSADFDYGRVGVAADWLREHGLTGFSAHWQKGSNPAAVFDQWFMNLFPRDEPFAGDRDGLATLNFIPSIATMILGVLAGGYLSTSTRSSTDRIKVFVAAGLVLVAGGLVLDALGICPVSKPIWTPAFVLVSGGWCFMVLAAFCAIAERTRPAYLLFPLIVVGLNSIVAYSLSHLYPALAFNSLHRVFGYGPFEVLGAAYEPLLYGCTLLMGYWLLLYALYRRRIFIHI